MRALVIALSIVILGCGGPQDDSPKKDGEGAVKPAEEVSPEGKKWGGWRFKGKRDDCFFMHGRRCFDSFEKACKAARCGDKKCLKDDAAPVSVYCEGDEPPPKGEEALEKYRDESVPQRTDKEPAGDSQTMPEEEEDQDE